MTLLKDRFMSRDRCTWGEKVGVCRNNSKAWLRDQEINGAATYISAWSLRTVNRSSSGSDHGDDGRDLVAKDGKRSVRSQGGCGCITRRAQAGGAGGGLGAVAV